MLELNGVSLMECRTCQFYDGCVGRCRRHAPTMQGWPVVYPDSWCGDYKLEWLTPVTEVPKSDIVPDIYHEPVELGKTVVN